MKENCLKIRRKSRKFKYYKRDPLFCAYVRISRKILDGFYKIFTIESLESGKFLLYNKSWNNKLKE